MPIIPTVAAPTVPIPTVTVRTMSPSPSSRWCPTPEQLMVLEELYRRGLRNPNSFQIQKITDHLSIYGKIQAKSVFYWFQNHKARDRQKLRKKLAKQLHQQHQIQQHQSYPNIFSSMNLQSHAPFGFHQFSNSFSGENLHPQVAACLPKEFPDMSWMYDLRKDCMTKPTYGYHMAMATNICSGFTCCRNRPLQTLQLFPLISPHAKNQETAS